MIKELKKISAAKFANEIYDLMLEHKLISRPSNKDDKVLFDKAKENLFHNIEQLFLFGVEND